jgi:ADP-ribosylation factor protein 1
MSVSEITDKLGLHSLDQGNGTFKQQMQQLETGLYEGLDWLSTALNAK